jgi:hypothetical protein
LLADPKRLPIRRYRIFSIFRGFAAMNRTSHVAIEKRRAMRRAKPVPIEHGGTEASFGYGGRTTGI